MERHCGLGKSIKIWGKVGGKKKKKDDQQLLHGYNYDNNECTIERPKMPSWRQRVLETIRLCGLLKVNTELIAFNKLQ